MITEELIERLKAEVQDEKLVELKDDLCRWVKMSRGRMSQAYQQWDDNVDTYRATRWEDPDDKRARQKREPVKMTVPLSYAQVETFVTQLTLLYLQNSSLFELDPTGSEDYAMRDAAQAVMNREVRTNQGPVVLSQFLRDVARMNLGVVKTSWERETIEVEMELPPVFAMMGEVMEALQAPATEEIVVREGNKVYSISPYNWFPDTRLPLTRWRDGQFCADETAFHINELKMWEREGSAYGVEHVTQFKREDWLHRADNTRLEGLEPVAEGRFKEGDFMVCVTEIHARIKPKDYDLGESENPEMWVFQVANDQRIVFAEAVVDANQSFPYDAAMMLPDQHAELSDSLSSLIEQLQETVTWLINSRVTSVRRNIENQLVIHPGAVELEDLQTNKRFIRMKKSAPFGLGVDKFIQQLKTVDPTTTHFQDVKELMGIMQTVSGVNENSMGQFSPGRRSATEARNVAGGAGARMRLIAETIWHSGLAPWGKRMLINCRQWMDADTYFKIVGESEETFDTFEMFHKENWWELVGSEDFFVFDSTSQSEKNLIAQSLQELALGLASNPEVLMMSGMDLVAMIEEVQALRGVKNLDRFKLKQPYALPQPGPQPIPGQQPQLGGPPQLPPAA